MSVNKVILVGNVGKDPDIRYFDNGSAVVNFPLATTERGYTAANGTQVPDRTEWHNIVCWRGLAKVAEQFVKKGTQLYIEGRIRTRSYDDQNGVKRYVVDICRQYGIVGKTWRRYVRCFRFVFWTASSNGTESVIFTINEYTATNISR